MTKPKRMRPLRTTPAEPAIPHVPRTVRLPGVSIQPPPEDAMPGIYGKPIRWWLRCEHGGVLDLCRRCG